MANNRKIVVIICCMLVVTVLTAYVSGPASHGVGNYTGSPTSNGTCITCHSGSTGTTSTILEVQDKISGIPATSYTPGNTYTITLQGHHPDNRQYGFQLVAVNGNGKAIGQYTNLPYDVHTTVYQQSQLVEHNMKIDGDDSGWFTTQFDWTPADSAGNITIYSIVNAVNGNGQPSFDQPGTTTSKQLSGPTAVSVVDNMPQQPGYSLYPNPFAGVLYIRCSAPSVVSITSLSGTELYSCNGHTIHTTNWPCGWYIVNITGAAGTHRQMVVKQ